MTFAEWFLWHFLAAVGFLGVAGFARWLSFKLTGD
jgi:hypothetical protein